MRSAACTNRTNKKNLNDYVPNGPAAQIFFTNKTFYEEKPYETIADGYRFGNEHWGIGKY